ncbi:1-hydroxycarotenoid 3,4-desaturase [Dongia mobilis]|uniref:1-hydroxycarotenoid 3,4-desaturase n=1 Tax=Dongia mobilis TaxID=578943 RepID=A0A4R6WT35_9PROT|nr:1-hydroxycarotenoid 3,4-desaturase CrtD [Dongia mobilis]TDQ82929.1 1-hydroxycarotenoid 3,4-desaturase [Dongia mobilis]
MARVIIIGAGIGGLAAAALLAARGLDVTVVERAAEIGGKMRLATIGGRAIDCGPTVFTMRWVFDELFADAGGDFAAAVAARPVEILARHAWDDRGHLDLYPDLDRSADAIGTFCGAAEARAYRSFSTRAAEIYRTLEHSFLRASRPSPVSLMFRVGPQRLPELLRISPFATLWDALGEHFNDPRLRQLFGRYATYCGSSPFQAPATLMLVAHVEREGVWLVDGGMHSIARALATLARTHGAEIHLNAEVKEIEITRGRATGLTLADGIRLPADAIVMNADVAALAAGCFGAALRGAVAAVPPAARSLSAVTIANLAPCDGFPLLRHNVFFSPDYQAEFDSIFRAGRLPDDPTVYLCAQDRGDGDADVPAPGEAERLFCLINAPPGGDTRAPAPSGETTWQARIAHRLAQCGLRITKWENGQWTGPREFNRLFPATGGALYGRASHGWAATFRREAARSRLRGLYLAGGGTHPGPGVPMAALSGRLAADALLADLASTRESVRTAMPGGMSTP